MFPEKSSINLSPPIPPEPPNFDLARDAPCLGMGSDEFEGAAKEGRQFKRAIEF